MIRRCGMRAAVRNFVASLCGGLVAGVMLGVSARIAMRLLAVGLGTPLRLTAAGTFTVIMAFSLLGVVLGVPYGAVFRDLLRRNPLAYAGLLILVTLQPFIRTAAQDLDASVWDTRVLAGAAVVTVVMWVPYAILLEASFSRLSRRPAHNPAV
jgi:hypothetical protein